MEVFQIMEMLEKFDPKVEFLGEQHVRIGKPCEYFFAFLQIADELLSLNVKYTAVPLDSWYSLSKGQYNSHSIYLSHYAKASHGLVQTNRVFLGPGADPRVVSNGTVAYGIITTFRNPGWGMMLYDFRRHRMTPVTVDAPGFRHGKNWQPFLVGDELLIVHELTPFRVLAVDVTTGCARVVEEQESGFNLFCSYEPYPMFRGGSNALADGSNLVGLGRTTSQHYRHQPFFWSKKKSGYLQAHFTAFFHQLNKRGYNIIDPTSIFIDNGDLMVGLCCTERDWAHDQTVTNLLLRFSPSAAPDQRRSLSALLDCKAPTEDRGRPRLDRHMFFCLEMPSAVPNRSEHGGRISVGVAGHLVHGPYIPIETEGRYLAVLTYLTRPGPTVRAGIFDVTISGIGGDGEREFRTLGQIALAATGGKTGEARIEFDTTGLTGTLLEFRVFAEEGVELNAFHIRTQAQGAYAVRPGGNM